MQAEVFKAIREDYSPAPFFFREEFEFGKHRWIAWTSSLGQLKELFYRVIQSFPDDVEILLKLQQAVQVDPNIDQWQRYHGNCHLNTLLAVIEENEGQVFTDGGSQLCVMCGGGGDYLALDEHGIFFLYADDENIPIVFAELGFECRRQKLVTEGGHWHYRPGENEKWQPFIEQLGLQIVTNRP
jgi:hypothetical protein